MATPTSRTNETCTVTIDSEKCTRCKLCVNICKGFDLQFNDENIEINITSPLGCVGCGHCMAVCPTGAITIQGREISVDDIFDLPELSQSANYEALYALLKRRRSIREFKSDPVPRTLIDKILETATTAPMGIPPSDVYVMVLDSKEKVRSFAIDYCEYLRGMKWMTSRWFIYAMRPFWGKQTGELFKGFVKPLFDIYVGSMDQGVNNVTYDAPLMFYFYGTAYCDPADPIIAATYAMMAAESLGLGTCMIGGIHPMIQNGQKATSFRTRWGIKHRSREGLFLIVGYPMRPFHKGIRRTFASVNFR